MRSIVALATCAWLLAACSPSEDAAEKAAAPEAQALGSGIDQSHFDTSVAPQEDFYRYVNGTWLKETEIPPDRSNYGSFTELADEAERQVREIIEEAAAGEFPEGSEAQQIGDLYTSFMDEQRVNELGIEPLAEAIARIEAVQNREELQALMAHLARIGVSNPFGGYVTTDGKDSTRYIIYMYQSGLGLPDRDYYLEDTPEFQEIRKQYLAHLEKMFKLAGWENPGQAAAGIMTLEKRIAQAHWTRVESRDRTKTYNKRSLEELNAMTPAFDWPRFFEQAQVENVEDVIVMQPSYIETFGKLFEEVPLETWKTWYKWNLINSYAPYLSQDFVEADFQFYGTVLSGTPENRPRWKRGVSLVQNALGMAVGKIYVDRHFPPEAKRRMEELVGNLIKAYRNSIRELDWMGEETKQKALDKLSKFTPKIGYPEKWREYDGLVIKADDLVGNVMRSNAFDFDYNMSKLGQPVDPTEWHMTPQTVNAYYNPGMNEIVFPAAILQPPFFNLQAEDAVNYGGIGAVIGHEIGHGFDDQGSKYDGEGNLNNWWTDADRKKFEQRTKALIEQYNQYCPIEGYCVNGELTIGENIGDLGGLSIAYEAYHLSLDGKEGPVIDGLTADQRLFMGWAQVWRRKYRHEELLNRLKTDPHSPSEYRCNGVVRNIDAFYEAFDVKPGDGMYLPPEERVSIW